ncbi:hypothetical protein E4T52_10125 [Aureobasidium sp. EXF-3400]|nr:hypothetical protein E4T51_13942 [Aureobasidium sp. EXF-12344]KAI4774920.1 hypothetical protein E4T52_10125 [Aureobasidium sp. EXF-3400]
MRMTRAQAAALAAAGEEADGAVDNHNDHVDDKNDNEIDASTTPTGEPSEREALAELTNHLDTNNHGEVDAVSGEHADEPEEQEEEKEHKEAERTNGEAENGEDVGNQVTAPTSTVSITNGISIHQDAAVQNDVGSPTTELPLLNITPQRTPAKNMIKNEFAHMRSTSNKENMVPGSPLAAAPVASLQTTVEQEQPEVQSSQPTQHDEQSTPAQKIEQHHHNDAAETPAMELESAQADDGQDDSLVGHFEALSVSPRKQKFTEQEVVPGAEQSAPERIVDQTGKQTQDTTKPALRNSAASQAKDKKAPASPTAKKPTTASSRTDDTKPARKPSVRQSTLGRQSSVVRKSMAPPSRPEPSTTAAIKRTTSVKRSSVRPSIAPRAGSSQSAERGAPANIPHSRPRPISMSFPTPPPPAKSTKAATQATFQLPGEAIAAKLKADKEARLQRQAEAGTTAKPTYKPPTVQKSTKAPTKATFQLPGEAIAAKLKQEKEERQKRQEENGGAAAAAAAATKPTYIPPAVQKSTKPVTKATFQLSSNAFAAKMKAQKEARLAKQKEEDEKREKERAVFKARPAPKISAKPAEVRQNAASRARLPSNETAGLKRTSSVRDPTAPQKRLSSFHPSASTTAVPPRAATSFQKRQSIAPSASKGKEVFGRAKEGKEREEKEKREKEEAAKKARADAAEAGRQRSREWAEKKKEKERRKTVAVAAAVV